MSELMNEFLEYCSISAGKSTLNKIKHKTDIVDNYFKGNLKNLSLKDIHSFLAYVNKSPYAKATKNDLIKTFKRFLKWKYPDWSQRFNGLKDAKLNGNSQRQLSKEDLLSSDEMNLIIKATPDMKYKSLFLLLQETACRPEEILKLKWKEVNLDKKEVKLHSSKTDKTRFIPIKNSADHLRRYKVECFAITPKADDRIFDITNQTIHNQLRNVEKELKLTKHLYPYLWRHSVLTRMIKILSPKVYEMFAGHSLETGMSIYAHLDNDDLREELNEKIYHIEELTPQENNRIEVLEKELAEQKKDMEQLHDAVEFLLKEVDKKYEKIPFKNRIKEGGLTITRY